MSINLWYLWCHELIRILTIYFKICPCPAMHSKLLHVQYSKMKTIILYIFVCTFFIRSVARACLCLNKNYTRRTYLCVFEHFKTNSSFERDVSFLWNFDYDNSTTPCFAIPDIDPGYSYTLNPYHPFVCEPHLNLPVLLPEDYINMFRLVSWKQCNKRKSYKLYSSPCTLNAVTRRMYGENYNCKISNLTDIDRGRGTPDRKEVNDTDANFSSNSSNSNLTDTDWKEVYDTEDNSSSNSINSNLTDTDWKEVNDTEANFFSSITTEANSSSNITTHWYYLNPMKISCAKNCICFKNCEAVGLLYFNPDTRKAVCISKVKGNNTIYLFDSESSIDYKAVITMMYQTYPDEFYSLTHRKLGSSDSCYQ